jgi:hypothetical protein
MTSTREWARTAVMWVERRVRRLLRGLQQLEVGLRPLGSDFKAGFDAWWAPEKLENGVMGACKLPPEPPNTVSGMGERRRVMELLMARVQKAYAAYPWESAQQVVQMVDAHARELQKVGIRTPTNIQVEAIPGTPHTFQVELELDGCKLLGVLEPRARTQQDGDQ